MIGFASQTYQCEPNQNVKTIFKCDKPIHMESSNISMPNVEELLQCQSIKEKELDVLKMIAKDKKLKVIQGESLYKEAEENVTQYKGVSKIK
jgi:hypothetical protein